MYQVLARKYRPRNFAELVGQEHVSKALTNALARGRLHHAYLFTGTRGVGKTTIARILSKCLNCETGVTATPCDVCDTCVAINQGRFIDLIEIDAASRTKVEDTRELLDNVPYAPTQGRYKVYLIDEVHMLSTHSFNALLKTLEEPPEHVKFLLATTDPQKLPITVVSRCLQFTLRPLPQQDIHDHLQTVLNKEHIGFDDRALWQLAEAAQGSLRDALSLTDQAIAYGQGQVSGSDVQDMLGLLDKGQVVYLLQALSQGNTAKITQILQQLAGQAVDLKSVLDQLITLLHQVALVQVLPEVSVQGTQEFQQQVVHLASQLSAEDVQLYYQIALQGRQDLKHAVTLQQGFDMCILRMLAFKPLSPQQQVTGEEAPSVSQKEVATFQQQSAPVAHAEKISGAVVDSVSAELIVEEPSHRESVPAITQTQESVDDLLVPDSTELHLEQPELDPPDDELAPEPDLFFEDAFEEPEPSPVAPDVASATQANHYQQQNNDQFLAEKDTAPLVDMTKQSEQSQLMPETSLELEETDSPNTLLMPQQILRHQHVDLVGTWDIQKWECWLREAEISPALRNLAQHGVMRGEIGGKSVFKIDPQHRLLATELIDGLIAALKSQWPSLQVNLEFESIEEPTPLQLKADRAEHALQQAEILLKQEPVISAMIQQFSATLSDVQLKE